MITEESVQSHLTGVIDGTPLDFSDKNLANLNDLSRIRKVYKLNAPNPKGGSKPSREVDSTVTVAGGGGRTNERAQIEAWVLAAMALRGAS
jgi:hypothetical protein